MLIFGGEDKLGFLTKLFGKGPSREQWTVITTKIAKDLEIFRGEFFQRCVQYVDALSTEDLVKDLDLSVVHRTLGEEADVFIKAYQLMVVSTTLEHHLYIPESQRRDFADLLYSQVCGTKLEAVLKQIREYFGFKKNIEASGKPLEGRVGLDVANYISGGNNGAVVLIMPVLIEEVLIWLNFSVQSAVTGEFGDVKTSEDIQLKARKFYEKVRKRDEQVGGKKDGD